VNCIDSKEYKNANFKRLFTRKTNREFRNTLTQKKEEDRQDEG
jgi:hypothetical protein